MLVIGHSIRPHTEILLAHPTQQTLPTALPPDALQPLPSSPLHLQQAINKHKGNPRLPLFY